MMIIAFQILLLLIIFASFTEVSSKAEKRYRDSVVIICIVSIVAFIVSTQL